MDVVKVKKKRMKKKRESRGDNPTMGIMVVVKGRWSSNMRECVSIAKHREPSDISDLIFRLDKLS